MNEVPVPWKSTGRVIPPQTPIREVLKIADIDWEIALTEKVARYGGFHLPLDTKSVIRLPRPGDVDITPIVLAENVGKNWKLYQNSDIMTTFDSVAKEARMEIAVAGMFKKGKNVWAIALSKDTFFEPFPGDRVRYGMLFSHPMIYGNSIEVAPMAYHEASASTVVWKPAGKFSHRREMGSLTLATQSAFQIYQRIGMKIAQEKWTPAATRKFMEKVFPSTGKRKLSTSSIEIAIEALDTMPGPKESIGTGWRALSAAIYCCDHKLGHSESTRLISSWFGKNRETKFRALKLVG
jgi:hypothetical protein